MLNTQQKIDDFERESLRVILNMCTESQINFFNRLYGSIDTIPKEKIPWAIKQVERTIKNNEG